MGNSFNIHFSTARISERADSPAVQPLVQYPTRFDELQFNPYAKSNLPIRTDNFPDAWTLLTLDG